MVNMGENCHHVAVSTYSLLLLVACMIGSTFHTAVAQTETPSAAPTPPADDTGSDLFPSPDPTTTLTDAEILRFERAATEDMGTYNIAFTTTTDYTHCNIRGFYDAKNLTTHTLITNCFNELSNQVEALYAQGEAFYSDEYYYPTGYPYCAIKCFTITDSSAFAVSSKQLSIVSAAAASMVFLALAHFEQI
ncbi:hypothetical protein AXG93_2651s1090 [Marchantia polymorpha subsp. ruderalis]|uniref:Gnk2-homologous domain-containing protein n=1 Tax=Marchantia polymorpha subsp. ruderalis TaxID=1480154 RepID=A0A176WKX6_MARPO|nr:hypothetical protein AXG93_2651s1090 [Marchantia polymorpha subsp. ruderalis]